MTYTCKIELTDYRHAMWLHVKPRKVLAILGSFLLALFALLTLFIFYLYLSKGQHFTQLCLMLAVTAYFGFFILWTRARVKRTYQQTKLLHEPFTFEATDTHLVTKASFGESNIPWTAFLKWRADSRLLLIYQSDVMFHIIPRQAFPSDQEFQSFVNWIATKLPALK